MKKIFLTLICAISIIFTSNAQFLGISGNVLQISTNAAVPNHTVYITSDSTSGVLYTSTTQTDVNGHYSFPINFISPQMLLHVTTYDCQNYPHTMNLVYSNTPLVADFLICYNPPNPCNIQFTYQQDSMITNSIHFTPVLNSSSVNCSALWSFGDGSSSTHFDPIHTYNAAGYYTVCLTIADSVLGCTATICDTVTVGTSLNCQPSFTFASSGLLANEIHFTYTGSNSANTQYVWNFGDGTSSTLQNPVHAYSTGYNVYEVCVTITENNCTSTYCHHITIGTPPCNISFSWLIDSSSATGYTYQFHPTVSSPSSAATVIWTFANGTTVTQYSPTYTFPTVGSYVVCMYYNDANSNCSGTVCDTIVIDSNNTSACHASYTYVITGNEVHFTYTGSASVNNQYLWNFGDGTSSTVQNPTHLFSATSTTHTVCLTLFNTNCQDSYCSTFTTGTPPPSYEVHGMVTIGTSLPADVGYVTLYSINPAATPFVTIQTTTIHHDSLGNAFYAFNTVVDGYYLAKASLTPNSQYYLTTLPTYHLSSVDWSTADMINVNGASVTAHINMILGSNTSGNGTITGNVIQGGSKGPGDALADVEIVLLNAGGIAVKHTISAVDGTFSFTNLAYGTYQILAEIAGISCTPYSITLNSSQTSGSSVTVTVNTNNAIINQIEKLDQINIISEVFPNPSSGNSYIDINGKDKVKVNIYNASGVMVSSTEYAINGTKRISLNTQQLPIGVYTVSVENTLKNNVFRKLIISK